MIIIFKQIKFFFFNIKINLDFFLFYVILCYSVLFYVSLCYYVLFCALLKSGDAIPGLFVCPSSFQLPLSSSRSIVVGPSVRLLVGRSVGPSCFGKQVFFRVSNGN